MTTPDLATQMAQRSDADLLAMLTQPCDWTPAALDAAKDQLVKRNVGFSGIVATPPPEKRPFTQLDILKIARRQRAMIRALLGLFLATITLGIASILRGGEPPEFVVTGYMLVLPFAFATVFRLAASLRSGADAILVLGVLVPLIALLALFYLNSRATRVLKEHGVHAGIFGARKDQIAKLQYSATSPE
jgi:hypothetical protein